MAVPSNTIQTPSRVGIREDLTDWIDMISPTDTPFMSRIGNSSADNVYTEWQIDALVAPNGDNKTVQGDDLANENRPATSRVGTYTQIMKKVVGTSTTARAVKTAGRSDEHAYQMAKAAKELKRDIETRFCGNYAAVPPTASVEGETAGALAWITTNDSRGSGGADPELSGSTQGYPDTAATNGTQRAFTETLLKSVISNAWNAGGEPSLVIMSLKQKQVAAAFSGLADQRRETGDRKIKIIAGADIYVSDVGELQFVPSRFCSARDALVIDPEHWSKAYLDPVQRRKLATTGLADREALYCEVALKCHNEAASGVVADLTVPA